MHGLADPEQARIGAGLEGGRVGVEVGFGSRPGPLHAGVDREGFGGHLVADVSDDDGVPQDGGGVGNCVEQVAGVAGSAVFAELAQALSDRAFPGGWAGSGIGRWRRRLAVF